ncbi:X-pro dipeptidyl-peptidase (S15 family) protein [Purpureocillium lilacinum]|uniref:X-pro dipeptidyl-peptidase (S15 family) protein n=1 Tax=Purpureocillium lilacinum TaxID=33203 RepID=A0A179FFD2_PURLI|nr:X-pro dipeptidyl-peptidase (S15 family) protein [Purpureocillium lilacinum]GJN69855.1 hypothetical protein PLICBS_003907 [Purpureocillium lilacinum]
MPLALKNLHVVDESGPYVLERDVDVPLKRSTPQTKDDPLLVRANVYRPKKEGKFPVLCTYGPYGKDIPYEQFHSHSFADVNPHQKSKHSAWETPDPAFWTSNDYVVVRADERGSGNSPGKLDSMSSATCDGFVDVVEWAAVQPWSNGKVGLLEYWYDRQVGSNQYGLGGRTERNWGTDSLEGVLSAEELAENRADQTIDTAKYKFRDEEYYKSRDYDLADIEVPVLSVANWGAIHLHLRGNIFGYLGIGSKLKYLRFITGRHDLPFYYDEEVAVQKSFLDAFLKGVDPEGWSTPGKLPPVSLCIRRDNPGFNNPKAERDAFPRRPEMEWPLARTVYTDFHFCKSMGLERSSTSEVGEGLVTYTAPKGGVTFVSAPFEEETEMTGHPIVRLSVSAEADGDKVPSEIDVFATLRHIDANGKEVFYTGAVGDPVPLARGWLRVSLRATTKHPTEMSKIIPERDYLSTDVEPVKAGEVYTVDIEIWPTNSVFLPGDKVAIEISSGDSEGVSVFEHNHPDDRDPEKLGGLNAIHIGGEFQNFLRLPIIPAKE